MWNTISSIRPLLSTRHTCLTWVERVKQTRAMHKASTTTYIYNSAILGHSAARSSECERGERRNRSNALFLLSRFRHKGFDFDAKRRADAKGDHVSGNNAISHATARIGCCDRQVDSTIILIYNCVLFIQPADSLLISTDKPICQTLRFLDDLVSMQSWTKPRFVVLVLLPKMYKRTYFLCTYIHLTRAGNIIILGPESRVGNLFHR